METNNAKNEETGYRFDFKELLFNCIGKWYWFVISISLAMGIAYYKVLRTIPVYQRTAQILLRPNEQAVFKGNDLEGVLNSSIMSYSSYGVVNEMSVISSMTTVKEAVSRLHLNVEYTYKGQFHKEYLYGGNLPFIVEFIDLLDEEEASFTLTRTDDDKRKLSNIRFGGTSYGTMSVSGKINDTVKTPFGRIYVKNNDYHIGSSQNAINVNHYSLMKTTRMFT